MSDFLLNLARRSVGLAAEVTARAAPDATLPNDVASPIAEPSTPAGPNEPRGALRREAPAPRGLSEPDRPPSRVVDRSAIAPPVSAGLLHAPPVLVQRTEITSVVATAAASPAAAMLAQGVVSVAPRGPLEVATATPTSSVERPAVVESPRVVHSIPERHLESSVELAPLLAPNPSDPSPAVRDATVQVDPVEGVRIEPRRPEILEDRAVLPAAVTSPPSIELPPLRSLGQPALRPAEASAERVVHVRIGAIEIHAAAPNALAAAPLAPPTAPASNPPATSGFDSYDRLRSYAPWGQ